MQFQVLQRKTIILKTIATQIASEPTLVAFQSGGGPNKQAGGKFNVDVNFPKFAQHYFEWGTF